MGVSSPQNPTASEQPDKHRPAQGLTTSFMIMFVGLMNITAQLPALLGGSSQADLAVLIGGFVFFGAGLFGTVERLVGLRFPGIPAYQVAVWGALSVAVLGIAAVSVGTFTGVVEYNLLSNLVAFFAVLTACANAVGATVLRNRLRRERTEKQAATESTTQG